MNLLIRYGTPGGQAFCQSTLVCLVDDKAVASAARLPDGTERWCVVDLSVPERSVHRDEDGYVLVVGEPAARAALEQIAESRAGGA